MTFAIASKAGFALMLTLGAAQAQTATTPPPTTPPAVGADTTPAPPSTTAPVPGSSSGVAVTSGSSMDCAAEFARLDVNNDGFLSEAEAPGLGLRMKIDPVTLQEKGVSREDYIRDCDAPATDAAAGTATGAASTAEAGAPFEGANSFTEAQATERATAAGIAGITALTKDDTGIWRGKGTLNGAGVDVAIDYRGNVVTTPGN